MQQVKGLFKSCFGFLLPKKGSKKAYSPIIAQYVGVNFNPNMPKILAENLIPFKLMNRVYLAFAGIIDNRLTYQADINIFRQTILAIRQQNPKAQILITSAPYQGGVYVDAAKNADLFADSIVEFIRKFGLDGYDMDWEDGIDATSLNILLKTISEKLQAASKQDGKKYFLTLAVWPYPNNYDIDFINKYVDNINIMSYGVGDGLKSDAEEYVSQGMDPAKIIGGVETEADYSGGVDTLGPNGSIAQKAHYAITRVPPLAGMFGWRADNDYVNKNTGLPSCSGARCLYNSARKEY